MVVGGSCKDDGSAVEVGMLGMDGSISPVVVSSRGIVCSTRWGPCDGSVGSDGSTRADILAFFLGGWLTDFLAREELAPGVVGGLLVSYRLKWELRGAPSTESGMASGCEGSIMEPCTGATLGALGRPEGDEVLAPRVFAMADLKRFERGWPKMRARLGLRWKSSGNGALAWLLFCTKWRFLQGKCPMWSEKLEFKKFKLEVKWRLGFFAKEGAFRSEGPFSQPMAIFTALFAAHFAVAKWGLGATKWHSCAKERFRSCEMRLGLRNWAFEGLGGFAEGFEATKWRFRLRNGTRVLKGGFAEGGYGAAKWFRRWGPILQQTLDFTASLFWLRNYFAEDGRFCKELLWAAKFRKLLKFLASELLLASWDLPSPLLQFLLN